jgi:bifunctional DNA-binding transcriptional regulator/antitoxin component of YhaV-PrlF toxin-antitoxin module
MQYCNMTAYVTVSKRGTITLPPAIRKKLGLGRVKNPMMLIEEKDGKIIMEAASVVPLRDIPNATIKGWIADDVAAMETFNKQGK